MRGEYDSPTVGGDSELEGDSIYCLIAVSSLFSPLTVHWPLPFDYPLTMGVVDECAVPSCRRSFCPRSNSSIVGLGGMSGDVLLPPIGGVTTVTHDDVASSNSWEELPLRKAG